MPNPNVESKSGKLTGKRQLRKRRSAWDRAMAQERDAADRAAAEAMAERAGDRARGGWKPTQRTNVDNSPPAPAQPKYGPYRRRAERDADLMYGDDILRAQAQQQNSGTYWDDYKRSLAEAQQQMAARYQAAQQALVAPNQAVGAVPAGVSSPEAQQAASSRQLMQQAQSGLLTAQGLAQQDYLTGRQTVGAAQQLQSRQQAAAEEARWRDKRTAFMLNQREQYRDLGWNKRLEAKAFDMDAFEAQQDAADDLADNRRDARENRRDRRDEANKVNQWGYTNRDWARMTPAERRAAYKDWAAAGRKPDGPDDDGDDRFTTGQTRDARRDFRSAYHDIRRNDNGSPDYWDAIYNALIEEQGHDPVIARAAIQVYRHGHVGTKTARALNRDYGIKVKRRNRAKRPHDKDFGADDYDKTRGRGAD